MIKAKGLCPYVGLQPFREEDYPYFFGRERDIRVISSNLTAQPLTILYGASGVGKSSVLRAGVIPYLRRSPDAVPLYFNSWQRASFLDDLNAACRAALGIEDSNARLPDLIATTRKKLFLLLDQFEELLLYHASGDSAEEFDAILAHIVNRKELAAKVLIGIREDALSRFDQRFGIRIEDLWGNTLPLAHLTNDAARLAILEPLRVFNERYSWAHFTVEPALTDEILRQVQPHEFAVADEDDHASQAADAGPGRVETPFLQLVLRRLWDEETRAGSQQLRLTTLRDIGGAQRIVEKHVNEVLARLPGDQDREIAAWMFKYLVTPSRSKIAQTTDDLIAYTEAPAERVNAVLSLLSDQPESRILRRLDTPERYEIFHDVLAQPVLDWRKKYFDEKDRLKEQQEAERVRREVVRLRWLVGAMIALFLAASYLAWYASDQRRKAETAATQLAAAEKLKDAAEKDAAAAREQQRATDAALHAREAELAGQTELAGRLRASADDAAKQAAAYRTTAAAEQKDAAGYLEGKDKAYRDAVQQIANLKQERDRLQEQAKQAERQNAAPVQSAVAKDGPDPARRTATLHVALARILVESDGSPLSAGWRFEVYVDGQKLFDIPKRDYDDTKGKNVVVMSAADNVERDLPLPRSTGISLSVIGYRTSGGFLKQPDKAEGSSTFDAHGMARTAVHVTAVSGPRNGAFTFDFVAGIR